MFTRKSLVVLRSPPSQVRYFMSTGNHLLCCVLNLQKSLVVLRSPPSQVRYFMSTGNHLLCCVLNLQKSLVVLRSPPSQVRYFMSTGHHLLCCVLNLQKTTDVNKQGMTPIKPLSHRERCFAQSHAIFLLRNITKVRRVRQTKPPLSLAANRYHAPTQMHGTGSRESFFSKTDVFMTQLTALRNPRSVKTRYSACGCLGSPLASG